MRVFLLGVWWLACGCADSHSRVPPSEQYLRPGLIDVQADASVSLVEQPTPPPEGLLPVWCGRAAATPLEQAQILGNVAVAYVASQEQVCSGLTRIMSVAQKSDWLNYIAAYSQVLAGCLSLAMPPVGGIRVFGLANTTVVGVPRSALSLDDVDLLIAEYSPLLGAALKLEDDERALLAAHLESVAEPELGPELAGGLSICAKAN